MPNKKIYKNESKADFKKRISKKGMARTTANKKAKKRSKSGY
tara:strand:- start:1165 stop:1290 length:126 start_codon:yes stop_codon:yes gene_type:complete